MRPTCQTCLLLLSMQELKSVMLELFIHFFGQCVIAVSLPSLGSVNNTDLVLSQSLPLHQRDKLPSGSDKIRYNTGASKPSSLGIRNVIQVET